MLDLGMEEAGFDIAMVSEKYEPFLEAYKYSRKKMKIKYLSGLPQLNSTLRLSIHEPFRQRIVMNYNLEGMTKAEGHSYVLCQTEWRRMHTNGIRRQCTGSNPQCDEWTYPRMLNKLCNASLLVETAQI